MSIASDFRDSIAQTTRTPILTPAAQATEWTRASFGELLSFFWRAIWAFSGAAFLAALCLTVPVGLLVLVGMWITR